MAGPSKWNPSEFSGYSHLKGEMKEKEIAVLQSLLLKYPNVGQTQSASVNASTEDGDDDEDEASLEPSSKLRKTDKNEKKVVDGAKKWEQEHTTLAIETLVEMAMQGHKPAKSFKKPILNLVVGVVNKEFKTDYNSENLKNHLKWLKKRWQDISWLMKQSGAGWEENEKKIVFEKEVADAYIKDKSVRKSYINVSLPYNIDQLRLVCGEDHATGSGKKSVYGNLGGCDVEQDEEDQTPMDSSTRSVEDDATASGKKQKGKGNGSSSSGKKNNEEISYMAMEKFADCMKWFGNAIITAHSQDHSQNLLKELNQKVMNTPGEHTRGDLDLAFMFLAKNEHYVRIFLAKPEDIQVLEIHQIISGIKSGKLKM